MSQYCQIVSTAPDRETAERLAALAIERRLAACAQVTGPIQSTYRWQGQIETANEWQLMLKTRTACVEALRELIVAEHPYEVPEFLVLAVASGYQPYLDWIAENTGPTAE